MVRAVLTRAGLPLTSGRNELLGSCFNLAFYVIELSDSDRFGGKDRVEFELCSQCR